MLRRLPVPAALAMSTLLTSMSCVRTTTSAGASPTTLYSFTVKDLAGQDVPLERYKDKPVQLVVNTASQYATRARSCGCL